MADERIDYDYSGRPLRPIAETKPSGQLEEGLSLEATKDGRWAVDVHGQYYLVDEDTLEPLMDSPIDHDQVL